MRLLNIFLQGRVVFIDLQAFQILKKDKLKAISPGPPKTMLILNSLAQEISVLAV